MLNYLVIFPGVGAFDHPFGPGRGEFEKSFSKNSNAQGVARGGGEMLKFRFDWYITSAYQPSCPSGRSLSQLLCHEDKMQVADQG